MGKSACIKWKAGMGICCRGFLEQHDQQIEQVEVNGIALVDGEKIFGEVVGGQKKIVICGGDMFPCRLFSLADRLDVM